LEVNKEIYDDPFGLLTEAAHEMGAYYFAKEFSLSPDWKARVPVTRNPNGEIQLSTHLLDDRVLKGAFPLAEIRRRRTKRGGWPELLEHIACVIAYKCSVASCWATPCWSL